jgi:hypothetical protein
MIMEFCEKGSLERAVSRGKFNRREDRQPEMVSHGTCAPGRVQQ